MRATVFALACIACSGPNVSAPARSGSAAAPKPAAAKACPRGPHAPVAFEIENGTPLHESVIDHEVTMLSDGRLMVYGGGSDHSGRRFPSGIQFLDRDRKRWTLTKPFPSEGRENARDYARLVGATGDGAVVGAAIDDHNSPPLSFVLAGDRWTQIKPTLAGLTDATSVRLRDGRVLFVGREVTYGNDLGTPAAAVWSARGFERIRAPRVVRVDATASVLGDGQVMVLGGTTKPDVEIWNPETGVWRDAAPLVRPRARHAMAVLPDGRVLVAGGEGAERSIEQWDPAADRWTEIATLHEPRRDLTATVLPDCRVVFVGGGITAEVWNATDARWESPIQAPFERRSHATLLASDGSLLVTGGSSVDGRAGTAFEIWRRVASAKRPAIEWQVPSWAAVPGLVVADGDQLAFITAGKRGGVDATELTDVPPIAGALAAVATGGTILVRTADALVRWQSGAWLSTPHPRRTGRTILVALDRDRSLLAEDTQMWLLAGKLAKPIAVPARRQVAFVVRISDTRVFVAMRKLDTPLRRRMRREKMPIDDAVLLDVRTGRQTPVKLRAPMNAEHAVALTDGRVMLLGPDKLAEIYDPAKARWHATRPIHERQSEAVVRLDDGRILILGGDAERFKHREPQLESDNIAGRPPTAEVYDPAADTWTVVGPLPTIDWQRAVAVAGRVVVTDGERTIVLSSRWQP